MSREVGLGRRAQPRRGLARSEPSNQADAGLTALTCLKLLPSSLKTVVPAVPVKKVCLQAAHRVRRRHAVGLAGGHARGKEGLTTG
jgi:hypothetical protein